MNKKIHKEGPYWIVEFENYLTHDESKYFIDFWNSLDSWQPTCFYGASNAIPPKGYSYPQEINHKLHILKERLRETAEDIFGRKLVTLSLSAHKWSKGSFAGDHADNAELDGTPNGWAQNKLVTIVYLNGNYEGGYLNFRDHEIAIKPGCGTMICFDVGIENVHAVSEITEGDRYSMLISYNYADAEDDPELLKKLREEEIFVQNQQKEDWDKGEGIPNKPALQEKIDNAKI